jgi:hypothetical protein
VEIRPESELADQLHDLGYNLRQAGTNERIVGGRFTAVLVYQFQIPMPR